MSKGTVFIVAKESVANFDVIYKKLISEDFDPFYPFGFSLQFQVEQFINSDYIYFDTSYIENENHILFIQLQKSFDKQSLNSRELRLDTTFEYIKSVVLRYFKIDISDFNDNIKNRDGDYVKCRQMIMYLAKLFCYPELSKKEIGFKLSTDRTNVIHHIKKSIGFIETDKKYRNEINEISLLI